MADRTHSALAAHVAVVRRRWAVAVIAAVVVLALLWPFAMGLPSLYRAGTTILVEETTPGGLAALGDAGEIDQRLQAVKQEAVSRARLKELVARTLPAAPGVPGWNPAISDLQRDIRLEIVSTTTSTRTGMPSTVAFKVTYVGRDPATVAKVANTVATFYVAQNDALRARVVNDTANNLKEALADAKQALAKQQERMAAFTRGDSGSLPEQSVNNQAALVRLNVDLQTNMSEQARQLERRQQVMDKLLELRTNPPADAEPELRLARLRKELADLRLTETENGPNVRAKQIEIATLSQQINSDRGRGGASRIAALESEQATIDSRLRRLAADRDQLRASEGLYQRRLERSPVRGTQLVAVMHDYNTARETHDTLQKRYDEAQVAERAQRGENRTEFRILDAALPPTKPSGPNRPLLLLGGLMVALIVGVGLAFVVDFFDTSFHDVDDLRAFTRVPVLAIIPQIVSAQDAAHRQSFARVVMVSTAIVVLCVGAVAFLLARGSDEVALLFLRRT